MDWQAVYKDIVLGLVIAGAAAALIPASFWRGFFFTDNPLISSLWGPVVGPLVAIISFVCSIGNIPLAAVLWNGGISFGGVIAFIYADLIVIPIINIYRKYYGWKMAIWLTGLMYLAMVLAGYLVEILFRLFNLIPKERTSKVIEASITWNYTTVLNLIFLTLALTLIIRFFKTDGRHMLHNMNDNQSHHH